MRSRHLGMAAAEEKGQSLVMKSILKIMLKDLKTCCYINKTG